MAIELEGKKMGRMGAVIVGVCSAAAGFLAGMLVAAITGGSLARVTVDLEKAQNENRRLAEERDGLAARVAALEKHTEDAGPADDWGTLAKAPSQIGPGSEFLRFLTRLRESKTCDAGTYWTIERLGGDMPNAHLVSMANSEHGKLPIEIVPTIFDGPRDNLCVTLLLHHEGLSLMPGMTDARNRRVSEICAAMNMNDQERERMAAAMKCLPIPHPDAFDEGMVSFIAKMPRRAVEQFRAKLVKGAEAGFPNHPPAIGIPLSDRWVATVVFGPVEKSAWKESAYNKPGPCWSIAIMPPYLKDYSAPPEEAGAEDWPRLTLPEVDTLTHR